MTLTYKIGKVLAKFLLAVIFRVQIAGTRKLPEGPVIVVSNHISNWDVLILGSVFDWMDILCYAVGAGLCALWQAAELRILSRKTG